MQADLVVTPDDYLACPDPFLETMAVDLTMVGWARRPGALTVDSTGDPEGQA